MVAVTSKLVNLFKVVIAVSMSAPLKQSNLSFNSETSLPLLVILNDEKRMSWLASFTMMGQLAAS